MIYEVSEFYVRGAKHTLVSCVADVDYMDACGMAAKYAHDGWDVPFSDMTYRGRGVSFKNPLPWHGDN